tara:strand:- start:72273 stop:72482 length:210 start_codon:yes stop_codon:yes gene_type:complete
MIAESLKDGVNIRAPRNISAPRGISAARVARFNRMPKSGFEIANVDHCLATAVRPSVALSSKSLLPELP